MKRVLIACLTALLMITMMAGLALADTRPAPGPWPEFSLTVTEDWS